MENPNGTAPSFIVEQSEGVIFALPGVPHELKWLFENEVIPYARRKFDLGETITYRVLKVTDMGESAVDHKIGQPGVTIEAAAASRSSNARFN